MEKSMYLSLFREYEHKGKDITLYRIHKINLYVIDIEGELPLFATYYPTSANKDKLPTRFPGDFEMGVSYQGWYVFKSDALREKLNLKTKTFNGYARGYNES